MTKVSRRRFLTDVAIAGAGLTIVPRHVLGRGFTAPSDLLNVAAVGVGGQGRANLINLASENVVALCDVDWDYANKAFAALDADMRSQQERLERTTPRLEQANPCLVNYTTFARLDGDTLVLTPVSTRNTAAVAALTEAAIAETRPTVPDVRLKRPVPVVTSATTTVVSTVRTAPLIPSSI